MIYLERRCLKICKSVTGLSSSLNERYCRLYHTLDDADRSNLLRLTSTYFNKEKNTPRVRRSKSCSAEIYFPSDYSAVEVTHQKAAKTPRTRIIIRNDYKPLLTFFIPFSNKIVIDYTTWFS